MKLHTVCLFFVNAIRLHHTAVFDKLHGMRSFSSLSHIIGVASYVALGHVPPRLPIAVTPTYTSFSDGISFSVAGPRVWNAMPPSLQQNISYRQSKRQLKTSVSESDSHGT